MVPTSIKAGQLQVVSAGVGGKIREVEMHLIGFEEIEDDFTKLQFYGERVFSDGKSSGPYRHELIVPTSLTGKLTTGPQAHTVALAPHRIIQALLWMDRNPPKGIWSLVMKRTTVGLDYVFSFSDKNTATMVKVACA